MTPQESGHSPSPEIVLNPHALHGGFRTVLEGRDVHVRGISPELRRVENYLRALRLRTSRGTSVVPPVHEVVVPTTRLSLADTLATGKITLLPKGWDLLPPSTFDLLRKGHEEGLFDLVTLAELSDYEDRASRMRIDKGSFVSMMTQNSELIFVSDWVGDNVRDFLLEHDDPEIQRRVGTHLSEALKALHDGGLIAGDTHLRQFVVRGDAENVERVDLNNIYSLGQVSRENIGIEAFGLFEELSYLIPPVAIAFREAYLKGE